MTKADVELEELYALASPAGQAMLEKGWAGAHPDAPPPWRHEPPAALAVEAPAPPPVPTIAPAHREPSFVPLPQARLRALVAAQEMLRQARPLRGPIYATRATSCELRKVSGLLGSPAMWVYDVAGYLHYGWVIAGTTVTKFTARVRADTGQVLSVKIHF